MNTTLLVGEILVIKKPYDHDYMHIFTALALFSIKSMTNRPFMLRHLLAEKQLGGSKRLPEYTFSASKEKSHYNLKNVKVWRPWGRIFSPICPTSRPYDAAA